MKQKFDNLKKTEEKISKSLKNKTSEEFIDECENNIKILIDIRQNFDSLFLIIKKKIEKLKAPLVKNKELYLKTLNQIANIKFKNDEKEQFLNEVTKISKKIDEPLLEILDFLNIKEGFACWIFDDEPKDPEDDISQVIRKGQYSIVYLEKQIGNFSQNLEELKKKLLDNCGKYGEFYVELNRILEKENQKEFILSDIENEETIQNFVKDLGEGSLISIIDKLSKFGLIKTKYSVES